MLEDTVESEREVLLEILQGVMATENLDDLLKLVHEAISRVLYAENCFVALIEQGTGSIHYRFYLDKYDPPPPPRSLAAKTLSAYVTRTGKPLVISDAEDPAFKDLIARGEAELSGTDSASWLGVPLRTPSQSIGVLVVQNYEKKGAYTQRHMEFLESIGGQVALAIERKRAEDEREDLIRQLRQALARQNTLKGVLEVCSSCKKIADEIGQWQPMDKYLASHARVEVSQTLCPACFAAEEEL